MLKFLGLINCPPGGFNWELRLLNRKETADSVRLSCLTPFCWIVHVWRLWMAFIFLWFFLYTQVSKKSSRTDKEGGERENSKRYRLAIIPNAKILRTIGTFSRQRRGGTATPHYHGRISVHIGSTRCRSVSKFSRGKGEQNSKCRVLYCVRFRRIPCSSFFVCKDQNQPQKICKKIFYYYSHHSLCLHSCCGKTRSFCIIKLLHLWIYFTVPSFDRSCWIYPISHNFND